MIYLWDIPDLVKDLKNETIPDWEVDWYFVLSPLLSALNGIFFGVILLGHHIVEYSFQGWLKKPHPAIEFYNRWGASFATLAILVAVIGIYLCYRANKAGDGKNFWTRMACLSFPVNLHITIYAIATLAIIGFFAYFFFQAKIMAFQEKISTAPVVATPFLPGKINRFVKNLRTMLLMSYPILALVPAFLSFIHYAILRNLIKQVSEKDPVDYHPYDQFD